jgi:hypothetical protein
MFSEVKSAQFSKMQDQTVKVAEARLLESEVQRLRDENADLRRRTADIATLEAAKKKAESRVEVLEEKVCRYGLHSVNYRGLTPEYFRWRLLSKIKSHRKKTN